MLNSGARHLNSLPECPSFTLRRLSVRSIFFFPKTVSYVTVISPLCLLVRLGDYIVNLCAFYFHKIVGKLTAFLQLQEFSLRNRPVDCSLPPRGVPLTALIQDWQHTR